MSGAVRYNPDDTITKQYRSLNYITFSPVSGDSPLPDIATTLHYISWAILLLKLSYCVLVVVVLVINISAGDIKWDVLQGVAPTKEQNSLHDVILLAYYVNYARWIAFTVGPRLRHMRLQRYRDLLVKIPNLRHTIKNVLLFISSDLLNFNMLIAFLIIIGSKNIIDEQGIVALPIAYVIMQYLFPPHMIKAIFEPHVKEYVVKPSILSYDSSYCPSTCCDCGKVFMIDILLNWLSFYLWACYWFFLVVGAVLVYAPVMLCGFLQLCYHNWPSYLRKPVHVLIIVPLLTLSMILCCCGELISGGAFSLLLTLSVLLIENELIDTALVISYFPDITRRLQPAASTSVDKPESSYLTSSLMS